VLALAVVGLAASEGRAQAVTTRQDTGRPARMSPGQGQWEAERAFHLTRVLERAKAQLNNTLLRIEIGTTAPIDADGARQAVAQIDALIKADAVRTPKPVQAGVAAIRVKLAEMLNALDLAEVKLDNGMVTTRSVFDGYLAVVNLLLS
jgi:hypothetical protein